ncbi:type II CAAX endopeptidase family protein [Planococcus sp. ISL-109]|uniref:CPBP family intramembrane glutamic endopeptidase n=1 Tax=Planococcus sp. ISL-109 TaxID=2819166 RepID=UPI001BEA8EFB|nr:type II CAAX endopeptidase family protein [Planococcus sp. ISL-109]MBT2584233.1 CPBP family intramembrane metalloprotease [Planococcus sp. ISL-109]
MFAEMKSRYLILFSILGVLATALIFTLIGADPVATEIAVQFAFYIVVPYFFFHYYWSKNPDWSFSEVITIKGVKPWLPLIAGMVLVSIAFSLTMFWLQLAVLYPVFPLFAELLLEPGEMPGGLGYELSMLVTLIVLAPVVEEFVFRGVFLTRFAAKTSMWGGILFSSLLFGILHLDFVGSFLFGIIASLLYLRTGNLLLPILFHMLNNALAALSIYVPVGWFAAIDWFVVSTTADIQNKALANVIVLTVSALLTAWIIYRLAKGVHEKITERAAEAPVTEREFQ